MSTAWAKPFRSKKPGSYNPGSYPSPSAGPRRSAFNQCIIFLAKRDHSEKELRQKLRNYEHLPNDIDIGIEKIKTCGYLRPPEELSERVAHMLNEKNKSYYFIKNYLNQKGLPIAEHDPAMEAKKCRKILNQKSIHINEMDHEQKARAGRLLGNRGFDSDTIRKVLYEQP